MTQVNEELADQVWEAWDRGEIDGQVAWWLMIGDVSVSSTSLRELAFGACIHFV